MTERPDSVEASKTIITTVGGAAAAAAATYASPAGAAVAAGLAALVPLTLGLIHDFAWNHKRREAAAWWHAFLQLTADESNTTPEAVEEHLQQLADKPHVREPIFRALKALLDSVDGAAVLPLARLTAEYYGDARTPDSLFRGAARLVAELGASELSELRDLLMWVAAETARDSVTLYLRSGQDIDSVSPEPGRPFVVTLVRDQFADMEEAQDRDPKFALFWDAPNLRRLFQLLVSNALAYPGRTTFLGSGPPEIDLERSTIDLLCRILRPDAQAPEP